MSPNTELLIEVFQILNVMGDKKQRTKFYDDSASALVHKLLETALACENCMTSSLAEENSAKMLRYISLSRDCGDICVHTAKLLSRKSELTAVTLKVCETACLMWSEECSIHDNDHCRACAQVCQECAEACQEHHGIELT